MSSIIRKVIRVGERSAGVTIPKEWLSTLGLNIGSAVELILSRDSITIKPIEIGRRKLASILRIKSKNTDELSRLIIAGYTEGYDTIELDTDKILARKAFYSVATKLPGSIAMDDVKITIKISVDELNTSVDEVISSMRSIMLSMFDYFTDYLDTGNIDCLDQLFRLDDDMDRLHFLGVRTIKITSIKMPLDALDKLMVIKSLEHIGDCLDRAGRTLLNYKEGLDEKSKRIFKEMFSYLESYTSKSINSYLSDNYNMALKVLLDRESMLQYIVEAASKCTPLSVAFGIAHEAQMIVALAVEIAEIAISKATRKSFSITSERSRS